MKQNYIYEHEIPKGTKLYFGRSASLKREIEKKASELLLQNGFSEIITPYFSYHQHLSVDSKQLLKFSDLDNHELTLRADSTVDVVRLITRRIKDKNTKKWFYIQPIFKYPSYEVYQIGAETIQSNNLSEFINIAHEVFEYFKIPAVLQISDIRIPKIICKLLDLSIDVFENGRLEVLLDLKLPWLEKLAVMKDLKDIDDILSIAPKELKEPLLSMKSLASGFKNINISYAPLYYSKMRYYDKTFFKFLCENSVLSSGGEYEIDTNTCVGFAIFTDILIDKLLKG